MITDAKPGKITFLGRLGEHLTRKIRFYDGDVLRDYPGAEISVLNQRPGDADSYPVPSAYIEQDGDYLYWTIQSGDLAAEGFGQCEMRATVDGKVALSVVYATEIGKSLAGGDEPPEPWEGYVGQVIDAADRAEAAAQLLENPGAEAVTLEPGAQATAGYEDGTFTFGIPAGTPGQDGEPGEDGYSPSVSVSKAGGTATITITDKSGTTTAEITDGQPGEPGDDGYSPSASVSKSGGTATITITDKNGTTTADVKDGADGQDGAPGQDGQDGYTPVRGTDYWTAADQAQIVEDVEGALIDDTAGAGGVTKVWSASKSAGEVSSLKSAIDSKVDSSMMQMCDIVEIEASANKWNKSVASVGYLHTNGNVYTGGSYDNYVYGVKIPVDTGDVLRFYSYIGSGMTATNMERVVTYDETDTVVSSSGANAVTTFTVPNGIKNIILTVLKDVNSSAVLTINDDTVPEEYIPYEEEKHYYIATEDFIPSSIKNAIAFKADEPTGTKSAGKVYGLDNSLNPTWIEQSGGDPTEIIDDEAGDGDTDKVWSADKLYGIDDDVNTITDKLELIDIEGTSNKWDRTAASVGMLHTNGTIYTGGTFDNYMYGVKIPVAAGDVIRSYVVVNDSVETGTMARVASYDSNDDIVPASGASDTQLYTVPNGISSVIITINGYYNNSTMVIINDSTVPTEYIPYQKKVKCYIATSEFIPQEIVRQYVSDKVDKNGENQVTIENCAFAESSKNLFDKTVVETGLLNKSTGAVLSNYTNYVTSDFIEVESSADYTFSSSQSPYIYWVWYDSSKGWISGGEESLGTEPTKQSPNNAKYIRFSITNENLNASIQLEKGDTATSYKDFGYAYIKPEYMPPESMGFICNIPKKVYALVGYETNIYFENIVEDWEKYKWNVTCTKGMQMERGFRITPIEADVGTYTLRFFLSIGDYTESFSTTLVVVSASAGNNVSESVIILGDSTTANSIAVTKLNANLNSDVYSISTIGTKGTSPNQHEGRSGWRFSTYFSNDEDNAFYNPTSQTFDANYYFTNSGVAKPDWFFINLGINDMFSYSSDEDLADAIEQAKQYLDAMIESINEASPTTKIGICLTIPPNHSQDAFGKEYKCGQNRNRYKRNNTLWVNAVINEYDDREEEGIFLIPIHTVLDTVYNMGLETIPVNARNTAITYDSPIGNGGVHPVESGYWQIADQYTAFLKGNAT